VDLSSPKLLYRGPSGRPNLWSAFFEQPGELRYRRDNIFYSISEGCYFDWYGLPPEESWVLQGVIEEWGGLTPECAARGRGLCRRNIALSAALLQRVRAAANQFLGGHSRWLAVHIRRTDKTVEAPVNFALTHDKLVARIIAQCKVWHCDGVFLCSDDATLKQQLTMRIMGVPLTPNGSTKLIVSTYPSSLSSWGTATHFDAGLDSYKKTEDVVMECLLMSQCHGLLSTFSNISVAAVFLSGDDYPYTYFSVPADHQALAKNICPGDALPRPCEGLQVGGQRRGHVPALHPSVDPYFRSSACPLVCRQPPVHLSPFRGKRPVQARLQRQFPHYVRAGAASSAVAHRGG